LTLDLTTAASSASGTPPKNSAFAWGGTNALPFTPANTAGRDQLCSVRCQAERRRRQVCWIKYSGALSPVGSAFKTIAPVSGKAGLGYNLYQGYEQKQALNALQQQEQQQAQTAQQTQQ
jgi:hypothetical protein